MPSKRHIIFIVLLLMICVALPWLYHPLPIAAQSAISPSPAKALPTPPFVQRVVIDPENSPLLTEAELAARLLLAEDGQPLPTTIRRPTSQSPVANRTISIALSSLPISTGAVIMNWAKQMTATFEGENPLTHTVSPPGLCQVYDLSMDGLDRQWGTDSLRAAEGSQAAWPARDGSDGYDPAVTPHYPGSMDTWIDCGPFDLRQFDDAYAQFWMWLDIPDPTGDFIFFGVSTNTITYTGSMVRGTSPSWQPWEMWYTDYAGESAVWLGWQFVSDDNVDVGQGVWLDDIRVWAYDEPDKDCDALDPGAKGLGLSAYIGHEDTTVPLFSDPRDLVLVKETGTHWTRLEFIATEYGGINFRDYDMIVDSLCGQDISTLALVDYQTLARKDWNTNQAAYRNEFTRTLQSLVAHFKNRVDYWEIWNEEDHPTETGYRFNLASDYADLLQASYETIKSVDPLAKVVFGGTVGVKDASRDYMQTVYDRWGSGQSYLDVLALHPYFFDDPPGSGNFILDPQQYLHYDTPTYPTMLAKFLETMSGRGDGNKKIWTTEIGWNSAYGDPNVGPYASQVITRQLQADYLTTGFDILFNEVEHWNQPGTRAVSKVFWFNCQDFGQDVSLSESTDLLKWRHAALVPQKPTVIRPMHFGLYDGNRNRKPSFYNFLAYPARPSFIYLPVVLR